jgi:hypothetical protein
VLIAEQFGGEGQLRVVQVPAPPQLPKGTLTGRAVDRGGRPADGLDVRLRLDGAPIEFGDIAFGTKAKGEFRIEGVPPDRYAVSLEAMVADGEWVEVGLGETTLAPGATAFVEIIVRKGR